MFSRFGMYVPEVSCAGVAPLARRHLPAEHDDLAPEGEAERHADRLGQRLLHLRPLVARDVVPVHVRSLLACEQEEGLLQSSILNSTHV